MLFICTFCCSWLCWARSTSMKEVYLSEIDRKKICSLNHKLFSTWAYGRRYQPQWLITLHSKYSISLALTGLNQTPPVLSLGPGINDLCELNKEVLLWQPFCDYKQSQSYSTTDFPPTRSNLPPPPPPALNLSSIWFIVPVFLQLHLISTGTGVSILTPDRLYKGTPQLQVQLSVFLLHWKM